MSRQGLMDDSGFYGFEECARQEECTKDAYEQGRVDGYKQAYKELASLIEEVLERKRNSDGEKTLGNADDNIV